MDHSNPSGFSEARLIEKNLHMRRARAMALKINQASMKNHEPGDCPRPWAIVMRHLEQLSIQEIAAVAGVIGGVRLHDRELQRPRRPDLRGAVAQARAIAGSRSSARPRRSRSLRTSWASGWPPRRGRRSSRSRCSISSPAKDAVQEDP